MGWDFRFLQESDYPCFHRRAKSSVTLCSALARWHVTSVVNTSSSVMTTSIFKIQQKRFWTEQWHRRFFQIPATTQPLFLTVLRSPFRVLVLKTTVRCSDYTENSASLAVTMMPLKPRKFPNKCAKSLIVFNALHALVHLKKLYLKKRIVHNFCSLFNVR
jgi:hypothetical protein